MAIDRRRCHIHVYYAVTLIRHEEHFSATTPPPISITPSPITADAAILLDSQQRDGNIMLADAVTSCCRYADDSIEILRRCHARSVDVTLLAMRC